MTGGDLTTRIIVGFQALSAVALNELWEVYFRFSVLL